MELHLIRHADAGRGTGRDGDHLRELTPAGREQCAALRRALERLGVRYQLMLTSPWTRARQTAGELAGLTATMEEEPRLAAPPAEDLVNRLRLKGERSVALVGHDPWLGELVALLLTGDRSLGDRFPIDKGGLYAITWPEPACIRFVLTRPVVQAGPGRLG
jgi:phosphohistidine phosphatase